MSLNFVVPDEVFPSEETGRSVPPFGAFYINWMRGTRDFATVREMAGSPLLHGAWKISLDDKLVDLDQLPQAWKSHVFDLPSETGGTYQAILLRSILVAPVARRWKFWPAREVGGKTIRAKSSLQRLVRLYVATGGSPAMAPVGFAVLTVGGKMMCSSLDDAFNTFALETAPMRMRDDGFRIPSEYFVRPIGSLSERPQFLDGQSKRGEKYYITPIETGLPHSAEDLAGAYVGLEEAKIIVGAANSPEVKQWKDEWEKE